MLATAADAMGDVITTSATVVSLLVFQFSGWNIDGIVGIGVSLVVMWAGVGIAKIRWSHCLVRQFQKMCMKR